MYSEKLVVITSFPQKGNVHDKKVVGIASYSKNTLLAIKQYKKTLKITVIAEILNRKKEKYEDSGIKIKRVWKRNSFFSFFPLIKEVLVESRGTKNILIEFEVSMFGNTFHILPFPLLLLILRLCGKKITIVNHQVIQDINELGGHINLKGKILPFLLNFLITNFYRLMLLLSSKVVVFDEVLKTGLSAYGNKNKITVIPHGVENFSCKPLTKGEAKQRLKIPTDDFVILAFGFIAWYKGTDWLINEFKKMNPDNKIKLIVAGGPNPNHLGKKYYKDYLDKIKTDCKKYNILLTGFVKEEDIPLYFQACDVAVLPYRTLMSASGPLSIALSFKKAFLVSDKLGGIFETGDIKQQLNSQSFDKNNLIFNFDGSFMEKVEYLEKNSDVIKKLEEFSGELAKLRAWDRIGVYYYEEIFKN